MPKGYFTPFTAAQEEYIKQYYLEKPVKVLAQETNSTYGRIMRFLKKNNLHLPITLIEQRKVNAQIKKGAVPPNKGKKHSDFMTPEAIAKTVKHRFKKGHVPHNTNKQGNGAIVTRKDKCGISYKYIRIAASKWELYHRWLWEQKKGPIPEDYLLVFKDGNSLNVVLSNLELITKTENMYRNSKHNYPEEIIPSLLLVKQVENKLKHIQNAK